MIPLMKPAAAKAPLEYLFAVAVCLVMIIGSLWVQPDITRWALFGLGMAMGLVVLGAAARPVTVDGDQQG